MRILVLSDSHGRVGPMEEAVEAVRPQQIFHLGDGWDDARELHRHYPDIPLHQVRGNCDYRPGEPEERRAAESAANGVPVAPALRDTLNALAEELGCAARI